ncbi:GMF family protein [Purpureocillium lavendulum]|uniref:GMF family protein n=1 Tax=Purpureocillium lavendulum TaxID=1247861 RepID=A0AB34G0Y1_9HYPO|nr:GMF family protein [Purpureocillium lavendulum]
MSSVRVAALQDIRRDQGTPEEVPSDDVTGQGAPGSYLYVRRAKRRPGPLRRALACKADMTCASPDATADLIDKNTHEIRQDEDETVYKSLDELGDDLPDHSPRYVLLSYPLTLPDGRISVPYVMLYYLPITCNAEMRMLYAGAKELMRNTSEVGRVIDVESVEDLEEIPGKLGSE